MCDYQHPALRGAEKNVSRTDSKFAPRFSNHNSQRRTRQVSPSSAGPHPERNPDFVLSLARGLKVIESFEAATGSVSVADVSRRTGLSQAAVRRLLITLETLGYAEADGRLYHLKPRVLRLGYSYLSSNSLSALAEPVLRRISESLREALALCVLEGHEVAYLAHCGPPRVVAVGVSVGTRLPAYCTSGGRVLLAALPPADFQTFLHTAKLEARTPTTITSKSAFDAEVRRVRAKGFALVDGELEPGLRSLAVPVTSRSNSVVAAINTGIYAARVSSTQLMDRILPALREGARLVGQQIP